MRGLCVTLKAYRKLAFIFRNNSAVPVGYYGFVIFETGTREINYTSFYLFFLVPFNLRESLTVYPPTYKVQSFKVSKVLFSSASEFGSARLPIRVGSPSAVSHRIGIRESL